MSRKPTRMVWQKKLPPAKYQFTPIDDVNRLILLHLSLEDVKNSTINKSFYKIVSDPQFWCDWLSLHYNSTEKEDCEFLAKISTSTNFHLVVDFIYYLLPGVVVLEMFNKSRQFHPLMHQLMFQKFFWVMWVALHYDYLLTTKAESTYNIAKVLHLTALQSVMDDFGLVKEEWRER